MVSWEKSPFTNSLINYQTPCTSSEGRLCNVFGDISLWNEYFWEVGLQLREFLPGELSLVQMRHADVHPNRSQPEAAPTLLCRMLLHHRCIVSVHLNDHVFSGRHQLICDALRRSPSLRKLNLCRLNITGNASQSISAALRNLNQLKKLVFSHVTLDRTSLEGLSVFLAKTPSLKTLTMTDQCIEGENAVVVLQGLRQNKTISELSLDTSILSTVSSRCGDIFADYLRCNQTLRRLTITSCSHLLLRNLRPIFVALLCNNNLSNLCLIGFSLDTLSHEIITDMLLQNRGLTGLHITNCIFNEQDPHVNTRMPVLRSGSSPISLWLAALAQNSTLEELTLDLSWIKPKDCSSFFKALASNTSLKKVNVPTFRQDDVVEVCRALQDTDVPERFFVGEHHVCKDTAAALPECKAVSRIGLYRCSPDDVQQLHTTLRLLPTCSHVNSLCLEMSGPMFDGEVSSLIAQYLTETTTLKELRLELFSKTRQSVDQFEQALLEALSNNKSIRTLSLRRLCNSKGEVQSLVETLQSSRTLCRLFFYPSDYDATTSLIEMLSLIISSNYTLLGMRTHSLWFCRNWYPIKNVVRRNNSLVTRAAHFVMGTRHKYCADAAELMQFNPGLVEKVQELASVDENEALSRIEVCLNSFTEMKDFMCLAGVVKDTLSCHRRDDGQKQFVDLDRECWLCIRQYLNMRDIK
ncbi:hypothetical protein HPB52_004006 [Rhipicephalus sanguineus]|uniref:Uncharacterized protein n=1 Tax=Rhipicephalus sanguineus TaxID=34632 RepID=A0A9D4PHW0_RHISA|nr:hypothetical protein HPB52_004006 [Rhipicephalus sanguineus]